MVEKIIKWIVESIINNSEKNNNLNSVEVKTIKIIHYKISEIIE